ncbi:autotransporter outer membrane beta-barrel domain-containing protein [Variovorax sp. dw_954]|uniref:autotransporter outer membrane beta-barrel domain-containing protein n=1 Tax=Variovorax sp. dw_954 TaxID=2720078 RepID=UPI001BD60E26|nr:autotransporter outer membrane beta-barrel domain-containing protein [Variovorax sp. dw_954]
MNKNHRVIWNESLNTYVAVQETARGRSKSSTRSKVSHWLLGAAALASGPAMALDVTIAPDWNSGGNSNKVGQTVFTSTGMNSLTGPANFQKIPAGYFIPWADAISQGYATAPDVTGKMQLVVGAKNSTITVPDSITGNMQSLPVYSASSFTQGPIGTAFANAYFVNAVQIFPKDAQAYVDLRLASVQNGTLNVDLGTSRVALNAAKQTALIYVDGTTGNKTEAVWRSGNYVKFGDAFQITAAPAQTAARDQTFDAVAYTGTFNVTDAKGATTSHTVTDLASLTQYNAWLVQEIQAGRIDYANYDASVKLAYGTSPVSVHIMPTGSDAPLPPNDPLYIDAGKRALLLAVGANATARVANPTGTTVEMADGDALRGEQGATVINDGRIATTAGTARPFVVLGGSQGTNNGVVTVGYASTAADASAPGVVYIGGNSSVDGAGSVLTNKGIFNAGAVNSDTRALNGFSRVDVTNQGTFINEGAMNIGSNDSELASPVLGVMASNGSKVVNTATGVLYLGREAAGSITPGSLAGSMAAGGADTSVRAGGQAVVVHDSSQFLNDGYIGIGSGMQDATGILVQGVNSASVVNNGTIDVKGARDGSPLENRGIWVQGDSGSSTIVNAGTINLLGTNGVGLKATDGGKATSTGTINLGTSSDKDLPNYGVWAEGAGSAVTLGGVVNLSGDNAIGVHARAGGKIDVSGGNVKFNDGERQVGFFAHGVGSVVNINNAPAGGALDVATKNSTLFRIEDGATINNATSAPLVASGEGSTAILVTGVGSSANLDNMDLTVAGKGATALKVEGGATGTMTGAAKVISFRDDTIAVSVDDNKHDLGGNIVGRGDSRFTNTADITVDDSARNVTVFQVKNGAELSNAGDIDLAHGTGIEITGVGSRVTPVDGKAGTITVHDGNAGIWVHGGGTLTTSDTITVDKGASGVLIGTDAGRVVLTSDASIIGLGGGFGNLVTNQGQAGNTLLDGTFLEMRGSGAALLTENNLDAASHGTILVSSNTAGKGLALTNANGTPTTGDLVVGDAFDISVTGNGSGVYANTTGDLTVTSKSVQVSGTGQAILVKSADTVTIDQGANITGTNAGAVLVQGAPGTLVNHGTLLGVAGSNAVVLDDAGHAFENSAGGVVMGNVLLGNGTNTALLDNSMITGNLVGGTGQDTVTVRGNKAIVTGRLDGGVGGATDTLILDNTQTAYDSATSGIRNFENVALVNGSVVTLKTALKLDDNQADTGILSIDKSSSLVTATGGAFALNNKLAGTGTVVTDTAGQTFDFTRNVGGAFAGTVKLGDSSFALGGANTAALQNATLELGQQSITTVGDGEQKIGGLRFNGGAALFNGTAPNYRVAVSSITVGALDASGTGTVQVNVPAPYNAVTPTVDTRASLLEQDDANIGLKLVNAAATVGTGGNLVLRDQGGQLISDKRTLDITQGGQVVAKGDYNYRLAVRQDDGLYVNYGLTKLDLQQGQTLTLQQRSGATGEAGDQSARITGSGNLAIDAGTGLVSLSNTANDYTGQTTVAGGTLQLAADNALGNTRSLNLQNSTQAQLAGHLQTIGQLQADAGSMLDLGGGTLNLVNGGRADGGLTGAGQLNIVGGTLAVSSSNASMTAATSIAQGAAASIRQVDGLGSGAIADAGTLTFDGAQGAFVNPVSGAGNVVKNGPGAVTVKDNVQHTGRTDINGGALIAGGSFGGAGAGEVTVAQSGVLSGTGTVNGHVTNYGTVAALNALGATPNPRNSVFTLANGLGNNGIVNLAGPIGSTPGNNLVVTGGYVGNNASLVIRTVLGGDASATDKLVIDGGSATGSTGLVVKSAGTAGTQTRQGIRVVETRNGATTTARAFALDTRSDGYRVGSNAIASGAFNYRLVRGGDGGQVQDWYLVNTSSLVAFRPPVDGGGGGGSAAFPVYRPEVGGYLANRQAALQMSVHTLHERQGQAPGQEGKDLKASSDGNGWVRVVDTYASRDGASPQSTIGGRTYILHGGADLARFNVGSEGSVRIGAMGMYGRTQSRSVNADGSSAAGTVDGYNLGMYATWYGNRDILSGPYVDAWILGGAYKNKVQGLGLQQESYRSRGITASLEAGYSFKVFDNGRSQMYVEPQAQLILQDLRADNHVESTSTVVSRLNVSGPTTRVGLRVHGNTDDDAGNKLMRPFAEVNWWRGTAADKSMMFDGDRVVDRMPRNRFEARIGLQGNVTKRVSVWGSVGGEFGARNYMAGKGQAGVKYSW